MYKVLNKTAKAINVIVDWGIDRLITFATRVYHDLKSRKGRVWAYRTLLGTLTFVFFAWAYVDLKPVAYVNPLVKAYSQEEIEIEELTRKLNEAKDEMQDLQEFKGALGAGDKQALVRYIESKDWDTRIALAVADCESGINKDRVGDGSLTFIDGGVEYGKSYGVFQIRHLRGRPNPEKLLDAKFNIDYAYEKVKRDGGWGAWTCYSAKYYEKHLSSL